MKTVLKKNSLYKLQKDLFHVFSQKDRNENRTLVNILGILLS